MPSNITVAITAETQDLAAKMAIAQSNLKSFSAETRSLADQIRAGGDAAKEALLPQLEASAVSALRAKGEIAGLREELQKTGEATRGLARIREEVEGLNAPFKNLTAIAVGLGEAMGLAFAGERLLSSVDRIAELGEGLQKLSERTGVSVSTLAGWHYAADQVGVSSESLDHTLTVLGRNIQTALMQPIGKAAQSFHELGLSQQFLRENANDYTAILYKMADGFASHADGAQADAIATNTAGRSAAELLPFLRQGSEAIQRLSDKYHELNPYLTGATAEALSKNRQSVKDLDAAWEGLKTTVTVLASGPLTQFNQQLAATLSGSSTAQIAAYQTQLERLKATLTERESGTQSFFSKFMWGADASPEVLMRRIDEVKAKIDALQHPKGVSGAGSVFAPIAPPPEKEAPPKPEEKPDFHSLSEPISELEKFRAGLAQVREAMVEEGATQASILAREAELWREEVANAKLSAKEKIEATQSSANAAAQSIRAQQDAVNASLAVSLGIYNEADRKRTEDAKQENDTRLAQIREANDGSRASELQAEVNEWKERVRLAQQGTKEMQEAQRGLANATRQYAQEQQKEYDSAFTEMLQPADTFIRDVVSGHETIRQAAMKSASQMVTSFLEGLAKIAAEFAIFEVAQLAGWTKIAAAASNALSGAGGGGSGGGGGLFGMLGGGLMSLFGGGGGGAAAGLGELAMFDQGTMGVPHDMLAMVHQGEIIAPAGLSDSIRSGGATLGGPAGAGGVTINANLNASTIDSRSLAQTIINDPTLMRTFAMRLQRFFPQNPSFA